MKEKHGARIIINKGSWTLHRNKNFTNAELHHEAHTVTYILLSTGFNCLCIARENPKRLPGSPVFLMTFAVSRLNADNRLHSRIKTNAREYMYSIHLNSMMATVMVILIEHFIVNDSTVFSVTMGWYCTRAYWEMFYQLGGGLWPT